MAEQLSKKRVMQPVGELDALLDQREETVFQIPFSQQTVNTLIKLMDVPMQPTLQVSRTSIVGILDAVRNHVLDWSLELEKEGVIGDNLSFSREEQQTANRVSYQIVNNIGSMSNSQLQQHSPAAMQNLNVGIDLQQVLAAVTEIRARQEELGLSSEEASELNAELTTIELQSRSPKPKGTIIKEALKSIKAILEGATGNIVAAGLLRLIDSVF